jgi:hypothetical protein
MQSANPSKRRSFACILVIMLCLTVKNDVRGQEASAHKTFIPKIVSDESIPKSVVRLLNALGTSVHPQVDIDHATKEVISQFVEEMLNGLHISGLRVDKPISFSHPTTTSFESSNDSSLKIICDLSKRAELPFSIRENNTFVFEPIPSHCVEYTVTFAGYTNGQETFQVTKGR